MGLRRSFASLGRCGQVDILSTLFRYFRAFSDKSTCVHELTDVGDIVCCACPNHRTVITGSTNSVVKSSFVKANKVEMSSGQRLGTRWCAIRPTARWLPSKITKEPLRSHGRRQRFSRLRAASDLRLWWDKMRFCPAKNIVCAGSRDCTVLVWDVASLSLIRQLAPHASAVSALAINESTGDIASAAGTVQITTLSLFYMLYV